MFRTIGNLFQSFNRALEAFNDSVDTVHRAIKTGKGEVYGHCDYIDKTRDARIDAIYED